MKKRLVATILCTSMFLSGCVISVDGDGDYGNSSSWHDNAKQNRKHLSRLQPGTSYEQVLNTMGVADFNEFYKTDGDQFQVLYYRTQRVEGDGITKKDECTPLVFKNGVLAGWGDNAYKMVNN